MNDSHSTDAELVAAALGGSRESFGALVERHQQFVCALAYTKTGSVAASEDLAQETFLSAWKNLARLRAPENFRGWLCGIVRNLAAKFHGGQKASVPLTDDIPAPGSMGEQIMTREEEAMLWAALGQLPASHREPLVLFHRGGQSVREIAEALELSEDAVKQRLSRGRAMLHDAVRTKVETALSHGCPGPAFTIAVLAGIPVMTSTAQAAGTGIVVVKSAGAVAGSGLLSFLGGLLIGVFGAWIGMQSSLDRAESERERRFIVRVAAGTVGVIAIYMAALFALIYWAPFLQARWPWVWVFLMAALGLTFVGGLFLLGYLNTRMQQRIRVDERIKRGAAAEQPVDTCLFEYRSRRRFLGLPLVHIRLGGCSVHVAKGWFAYGTLAVSPLLALGGVGIAPISMGGLAVGGLVSGGVGLGLVSFSGVSLGAFAMGGLAIGWIAIGGAAWGWLAAMGGKAWAGLYGMGYHVSAPHANDAMAKAFFHDNGLMQIAQLLADHGWLAQMIIFLPMAATLLWVRRLQRRQQS